MGDESKLFKHVLVIKLCLILRTIKNSFDSSFKLP